MKTVQTDMGRISIDSYIREYLDPNNTIGDDIRDGLLTLDNAGQYADDFHASMVDVFGEPMPIEAAQIEWWLIDRLT